MAFNYRKINPEICDSMKELAQKPSDQWTDEELTRAALICEAISIVVRNEYAARPKKEVVIEKPNPVRFECSFCRLGLMRDCTGEKCGLCGGKMERVQ